MIEVMRKPEMTKNTSTPMKPPLNAPNPKWYSTTGITASARSPSMSRRLPNVCMTLLVRVVCRKKVKKMVPQRDTTFLQPFSALLALHRQEELIVGLGLFQLVDQELDGSDFIHRMQQLAQNPHALQLVVGGQQLFAAGAGAVDVDGREHALFGDLAIQRQFHVAGAFEFFVDHFVHLRAGFNQRGSDDGQRAAFFDVRSRTEETLWFFQRVGVDTTGQYLAGARDDGVIGASQTGNGVEQDDHVFLVLDQALGLLDHHFGDLHVTGGWLIEGGGNHFAAHGALHFGYFFRTLIDQQNDQMDFRVVASDVRRDVLQHDGLAR